MRGQARSLGLIASICVLMPCSARDHSSRRRQASEASPGCGGMRRPFTGEGGGRPQHVFNGCRRPCGGDDVGGLRRIANKEQAETTGLEGRNMQNRTPHPHPHSHACTVFAPRCAYSRVVTRVVFVPGCYLCVLLDDAQVGVGASVTRPLRTGRSTAPARTASTGRKRFRGSSTVSPR